MTFSVRTSHGDHRTPGDDPPSSHSLLRHIGPGILLTQTASQTTVEVSKELQMSAYGTTRRPASLSFWQIFACLLLAVLSLYNPFLAAHPSNGSITVCHPVSYRATVGSSELEPFTQPDNDAAESLPEADAVHVLILQLADPDAESRQFVEHHPVVNPQTSFSSSLWFRPPPAV